MNGVKICGTGSAVPKNVYTNEYLSTLVDTSDEWIKSRTGIESRYIAKEETTTGLAIEAARKAINKSGIKSEEIDLVIVATITPDIVMPSTACSVAAAIGATHATAFDLGAACSGFLYASKVATNMIKCGSHSVALVIGAEVLSKVTDFTDRNTCVLFGDGAGAVIYAKHHKNHILGAYSESDGTKGEVLTLKTNMENTRRYMQMDGREVYKFATTVVPKSIEKVVYENGYTLQEVDCFILHQANARIMDSVAKKLQVDSNKFFKNLNRYGNTSAASIPIALDEASSNLQQGDKIVLCGFGGGLTWGSMLVEW